MLVTCASHVNNAAPSEYVNHVLYRRFGVERAMGIENIATHNPLKSGHHEIGEALRVIIV